ncbi:hypothetical protein [Azospirillum argentinense]|nr:hypothetical protein [Azospirillum argentinense]
MSTLAAAYLGCTVEPLGIPLKAEPNRQRMQIRSYRKVVQQIMQIVEAAG